MNDDHAARIDPIAIIGMSCRLPGAPDIPALWRLLRDGASGISAVPADRWHDPEGRPAAGRAGFVERVGHFDAGFFGISPREAAAMDPQQRLALELAWEAFEDAGIVPAAVAGSAAGVFIGAMHDDYAAMSRERGWDGITSHTLTGLSRGIAANRISYTLGLHGPSFTVDAAQSSALVAVYLASESIHRGESTIALAGGVNLNLTAAGTVAAERFGALSPDGECFTFDARANGYARGEGGGIVVLKRLTAAIADGDSVYCVIRGGAVNNDGAGDNLTAPNEAAQRDVLRLALRRAGVDPAEVQYVELHGTGTVVGDPIEASALGSVYGAARPAGQPLVVGSAKTNVGHLEAAAGIVGLLKAALAIKQRLIPASRNFERPNPRISLPDLNLRVQQTTGDWPDPARPLFAGVSSFGMGGTNCHLVLSGHQLQKSRTGPAVPEFPLPWLVSGRTAEARQAQAARLLEHLGANADLSPVDVAYSLATTRTVFEHRAAIVHTGRAGLLDGLAAVSRDEPHPAAVRGSAEDNGKLAYLFSGQGAQRAGMGAQLHATIPFFAQTLDEVSALLDVHLPRPLREVLFAGDEQVHQTAYTQAGLFAVEVALYRLFEHWGVTPDLLMGHSVGELAAAHVAGVMSLADACALVAARGTLMQRLPPGGAMIALESGAAEALSVLAGRERQLALAAVNGPMSVVVSGDLAAVGDLAAEWAARGRKAKLLRVSHAFHSHRLEPMLDEFRDVAAGLTLTAPTMPLVSNVTGELVSAEEITTPEYWVAHARRTVRFADGMRCLQRHQATVFLELGPDGVLTGMGPDCLDRPGVFVAAQRADRPEPQALLEALAKLQVAGVRPDWQAVFAGTRARRVPLPGYAFQRQRYWLDERPQKTPPTTTRRLAEPSVLDLVRTHTAAVLGNPVPKSVDTTRSFRALGLDSLMSVELRDSLSAATSLQLPSTVLFDHPTPRRLAEHLRSLAMGAPQPNETARLAPGAGEPIAIVGMSCRYPGGADSPRQLWELIAAGGDAISAVPADRGWDAVHHGGFLADAAGFDAGVFGISPREALAMDPQQRVLLEASLEAFENAGIDPGRLRDSPVGVFVGATSQDYGPRLHEPADSVAGLRLTGNTVSVLSGRVAYWFGFVGPAVTVDTACSSSLVGLHLACQSLRSGECSLALAGGVAVMANPGMFVEFSRQGGLAPDGRCKSFAEAADGTSWSEGVGALVLERLSDAVRNGHRVLATVRGSAMNQDGASNGLTAPSGLAQQRVITAALANAGLSGVDVDVVEAHGTGTRLGDPIEAQAVLATYGQGRPADRPLRLGSLKSNIGHTQAAAGVAGVIKMVLAMRHRVLPKSLHVDAPSSQVDWSAGAVELLTEARAWPGLGRSRRAGVSSFGISGTNAHVILEEGQADEEVRPTARPSVIPLVLSGSTETALDRRIAQLQSYMDSDPALDPIDAGFTLANRLDLDHRALMLAVDGKIVPSGVRGVARQPGRVVFLFPGEGAAWTGMASELLASSEVFAARIEECRAEFQPHVDWDLLEVLADEDALAKADVVRPVLFAVMVGLARLWQSIGVVPDVVLGHAEGEVAAAVVAGELSLRDGALMVCGPVTTRFTKAEFDREVRSLADAGSDVFVEVSAHPVATVPAVATLRRGEGGLSRLLTSGAQLWTQGVRVDWAAFFDGLGAHRVELPSYPFEHQRYWLTSKASTVDPVNSSRYQVSWTRVPDSPTRTPEGRWLLAVPASPVPPIAAITDALRSAGLELTRLEVTPDLDRQELATQIRRQAGSRLAGIVSLLALDDYGFANTLALVQAAHDVGIPGRLWSVTQGAVRAGTEDRPPEPSQAEVWGLGRVAALEFPRIWGGLVDLPSHVDSQIGARLTTILAGATGEDQLAVRESGTFARRIRRAEAPVADALTAWTPRGTVLVTGGTGALGGHVARWLAANGAEHIVLASRSPGDVPRPDIEAKISVVRCDVADRAEVEDLLSRLTAAGSSVRAVVHAAGVMDDIPLDSLTPAQAAEILRPKTIGARNLYELLPDLEAFILFSSVAGVWGSAGNAAYAAGNAFLDALAEHIRAQGKPATSVAWGPWAEGGMMSRNGLGEQVRRHGLRALPVEHAMQALERGIASAEATSIVADVDWDRFAVTFTAGRTSALFSEIPEAVASTRSETPPQPVLAERLAAVSPARHDEIVTGLVRAEVAAVLGHRGEAAIDPGLSFKQLGFDSVTSVDLRNRLQTVVGSPLPVTVVFDHPTPSALAQFLMNGDAPDSVDGSAEPGESSELSEFDDMDTSELVRRALGGPLPG
jgi:acyl transferase domain-containing protein